MEPAGWVIEAAQALQASPLGQAARRSPTLYPGANVVHLAGLVTLVGSAVLLDLRILGVGRQLALPATSRLLSRTAAFGLLLAALSGLVLFSGDAVSLAGSPIFQAKLSLIAMALLCAGAFRLRYGDLDRWPDRPPLGARGLAGMSLALWPAVGTLGRLIGYEA